jgi:hypothetical protein
MNGHSWLFCGACGGHVPLGNEPDWSLLVGLLVSCPACGRRFRVEEEDGKGGWFLWLDPLPADVPPLV